MRTPPKGTLLVSNSAQVTPGSWFYLTAKSQNAENYLQDALVKHPGALVLPKGFPCPETFSGEVHFVEDVAFWFCRHVEKLLWERMSRIHFVGITGTKGKTTIAWILAQALGQRSSYFGTLGIAHGGGELRKSSNTTVDLQTFLNELPKVGALDPVVVMEVSSQGLDAHRVPVSWFKIRAFTDLSEEHLDHHGDMETYFASKARFFTEGNFHGVQLSRSEWGHRLAKMHKAPVLWYGLDSGAELKGKVLREDLQGLELELEFQGEKTVLHSGLCGFFNAENLLAVIAILLKLGYGFSDACKAVEKVRGIPGRLQRVKVLGFVPTCFVDYAHSAQSLEFVLEELKRLCPGKLHLVFGCGGDRDRLKRPRMAKAAEEYADVIWLTQDNPRYEDPARILDDIQKGFSPQARVRIEADRKAAIFRAVADLGPEDVLLVAGKGHEDYQILGDRILNFSDVAVLEEACQSML